MKDFELELDSPAPIEPADVSDSLPNGELPVDPNSEKFVSFVLGSALYAVPAASVAEVTHPLTVTGIPGAHDSFLGVAPLRGEIVAVVDLKGYVGQDVSSAGAKTKSVVLNADRDAGDLPVAFAVDHMHEILAVSPAKIGRIQNAASPAVNRFAETESGSIHIIDPIMLSSALTSS
jgi:purine-binding chemotaxis protein CheW